MRNYKDTEFLFSFPPTQTSMTDSEYNLDASCLSRCSTELFSEASWEQVDKNDTEVSCLAEWDATIGDLEEGWKMNDGL